MKQNQQPAQSAKDELRGLRIFYLATIVGVTAFFIISLFITKYVDVDQVDLERFGNAIVAFVALVAGAALFYSRRTYNKELTDAKGYLIPLASKLNHYRNALIRYAAFCEGPGIFGIILFIVTSNYMFLVIAGIMILALLTKAPTLKRTIQDLDLDAREQQELS
jgi:hypothetical protein